MAGRPRATGESAGVRDSRQDLLDAAAELFIAHGFAATSTRAIADRAGLRQASLYHYFSGKEEILTVLLSGTVRPSLQAGRTLHGMPGSASAKLWALCQLDLELLCGGRYNLGVLYLRPEIQAPTFTDFHTERASLRALYRSMVLAAGADETSADLVFGLVEGVILTRQWKEIPDVTAYASAGADAGVQIACPHADLVVVRTEALALMAKVD
ncbi:TetR/AcrR family transcriptional regulator [Actinocrispum wychmicini]|nr:TetR/AcrR family transcriptional regulator [Actinocrispum wychmicini]